MKPMFVVAASSLLLLAGCGQESPEVLSQRAEKAYGEAQYSKTITAYERLLTVNGESPITYNNLALAAYQAQDYSYAIKMAEKALSLGPDTETTDACYELLGMVAEKEKDYPRAATYYRKVLGSPNTALRVRVHSRLAKIYAEQTHYDAALALLLNAQEMNPMDATTLFNLGMLCKHEAVNLRQSALDWFRQAERMLPEGSDKRKEANNQVRRLDAYLTSLKQVPAVTGNASSCANFLKQMQSEVKRKNFKSAENLARKAMTADPSNYEAALELGRICKKNKRNKDALKAYDTAIALRPNAVDARYEAAQIAFDTKQYKTAADYLRPALVANPKSRAQADLMGRILFYQRQKINAKLWYERALRLTPNADEKYRSWVQQLPEA
jgi:tetratricopeptide (TPR) repeat protein